MDTAQAKISSRDLTTLAFAQRDMRFAYLGGGPGMLASALVWAVAAAIASLVSPQRAVWALFIGGVFIHPVGVLLARVLGRTGQHARGNPLGALAMATTIWMIMMLPLAYGIALLRMDLFFPAMLFVIGGRYLCFQTLYGSRLYWACGAVLGLAGYGVALLHAPPALAAFTGAAIECLFACVLLGAEKRE
jgi:hypothetical protein